jgi:hypothetical protein
MANRRKNAVPDVDAEAVSPSSESPLDTYEPVIASHTEAEPTHSESSVSPFDPVTVAEGPTEKPSAPSDINTIVKGIKDLICVPRARGAVPALISYKEGYLKRYCIIDVDGENLRKAWEFYKTNSAAPNPAEFVHLVINILATDFPRMYRDVTLVPLN